jgi:hypothetical protein
MSTIRTTLRLEPELKHAAEKQAIENGTTLQKLFNDALDQYLNTRAKTKAKKIVFHTHDLGKALDNLHRSDYYPEAKV